MRKGERKRAHGRRDRPHFSFTSQPVSFFFFVDHPLLPLNHVHTDGSSQRARYGTSEPHPCLLGPGARLRLHQETGPTSISLGPPLPPLLRRAMASITSCRKAWNAAVRVRGPSSKRGQRARRSMIAVDLCESMAQGPKSSREVRVRPVASPGTGGQLPHVQTAERVLRRGKSTKGVI